MSDFIPTNEWQVVGSDDVLPPGCEIRMNMKTGVNEARLRPFVPPRLTPELKDGDNYGALSLLAILALVLIAYALSRLPSWLSP